MEATADAAGYLNKDICISAHIYDVVLLADGTRFLDVCSPETPDAGCRFTVVSSKDDWSEVGELNKYRDADVHIRGIVQAMHGRTGMMLPSHARQFYGGPPKFRESRSACFMDSQRDRLRETRREQIREPARAGRTAKFHEFRQS